MSGRGRKRSRIQENRGADNHMRSPRLAKKRSVALVTTDASNEATLQEKGRDAKGRDAKGRDAKGKVAKNEKPSSRKDSAVTKTKGPVKKASNEGTVAGRRQSQSGKSVKIPAPQRKQTKASVTLKQKAGFSDLEVMRPCPSGEREKDLWKMQRMSEVPSICHLCWLAKKTMRLPFFIPAELEYAMLNPRKSKLLAEIFSRLLTRKDEFEGYTLPQGEAFPFKIWSGLLAKECSRWVSICEDIDREVAEAAEMEDISEDYSAYIKDREFLRDTIRGVIGTKNPFEEECMSYETLNLELRVRILKLILDVQLEEDDGLKAELRELEASDLRVEPIGRDSQGSLYYYFGYEDQRIYRQKALAHDKKKGKRKGPVVKKSESVEEEGFELVGDGDIDRLKQIVREAGPVRREVEKDLKDVMTTLIDEWEIVLKEKEEERLKEEERRRKREELDRKKAEYMAEHGIRTSRRIAVIAAQKKRDEAERLVQDVPSEIAAKIAESEALAQFTEEEIMQLDDWEKKGWVSFLKLQKLRAEKARERAEIEREREQEKERKRRLAEERARLREEKSREEEEERKRRAQLRAEQRAVNALSRSRERQLEENEKLERERDRLYRRAMRARERAVDLMSPLDMLSQALSKTIEPLLQDSRFKEFGKPVTAAIAPDYYMYVANPMDLSTLKLRTDALCYDTVAAFQRDLRMIESNCVAYCEGRYPVLVEKARALVQEWEHCVQPQMSELLELESQVHAEPTAFVGSNSEKSISTTPDDRQVRDNGFLQAGTLSNGNALDGQEAEAVLPPPQASAGQDKSEYQETGTSADSAQSDSNNLGMSPLKADLHDNQSKCD